MWIFAPFWFACTPAPIAVPVGRIDAPLAIEVRNAPLGRDVVLPIRVVNTGTTSASINVQVDAPFRVTTAHLSLRPGERSNVPIVVKLTDYSALSATVRLIGTNNTVSVSLIAAADPDYDRDGHLAVAAGGDDCDDDHADAYPGRSEVCDNLDNDCDGSTDNNAADAFVRYVDADGDRYGSTEEIGCQVPNGYAAVGGDCDDTNAAIHPGSFDIAVDGLDNNCDGRIDEYALHPHDLVFSEVMVDPSTGLTGQYLELANRTDRDVSLAGFSLTIDGSTTVFGADAVVLADDVWLVCASDDPNENGGIASCDATFTGALTGQLSVAGAAVLDGLNTDSLDVAPFTSRILRDAALELGNNDVDSAWCYAETAYDDDFGTPGVPGGCP